MSIIHIPNQIIYIPEPIIYNKLPTTYIPEFLYKYTSVKRTLQVLLTNEVYCPHRRELNDPFDGRVILDVSTLAKRKKIVEYANNKLPEMQSKGYHVESNLDRMPLEEFQKRFINDKPFAEEHSLGITDGYDSANLGIYCFTERKDSLVMWAHYAANHKGCCLEFDMRQHHLRSVERGNPCFPFTYINMVRSSDTYPKMDIEEWGDKDELLPSNSGSLHMTKSKEWKYEKEWRAIIYDTRSKTPITGRSFPDEFANDPSTEKMTGAGIYALDEGLISGVILGYQMDDSDKKSVINATRGRGIKVHTATPDTYKYGMNIKPLSL